MHATVVAAIQLERVHVAYPATSASSPDVLHDVSASIPSGTLCALLGPNGAGKSSLIRAVAGLVAVARGSISVLGRPLSEIGRPELARTLAVVPQRTEIAFGFTVRQVVQMGRAPHQGALMRERRGDRAVVDGVLAACSLEALEDRAIAELSGGEQQRVHVARALAQQPEILLLDEAAAHLDIRHQESLFGVIRRQIERRGITCLAAMHDFNAAYRHADHALLLRDGEVVAHGPVSEILVPEIVSRVFGVTVELASFGEGGRALAVT